MSSLLQEFSLITSSLKERNIPYAVCGGWAMAIHGLPRATFDIDLLILFDDLDKIWTIAGSLGYDVEGLPLSFDKGTIEIRRISKLDKESKELFTLDLLLVTKSLTEVWTSREKIAWEGGEISVVSKKGLIKLKSLGGREQDLLDVKKLKDES